MSIALVIDDHPMIHLGCVTMLGDAGFDEVICASSAEEAMESIQRKPPAFVVLDLSLPGASGLESIHPLLEAAPQAQLLVFTMNDRPAFAARVLEAGAHGFLSKNAPPSNFREAVKTIQRGEIYLDHEIAIKLATRRTVGGDDLLAGLTPRERSVLFRIGNGQDLSSIAADLSISYKTAANASSALKKKLGARGLNDLIRIAIENASVPNSFAPG